MHGSICRFSSKVLNKSRRARWNGKTAAFVLKTFITAENVSGVLTSVLLFFSWEPTCSSLSPSLVYSVDAICNFYTLSAEMIIGDLGITARVSLTVIVIVWESVFLGNKTKVCILFIHSVTHIRCNVLETSFEVFLQLLVYKTVERNKRVVSLLTVPQIFYWCSPVVTRKSASSWITATFWWYITSYHALVKKNIFKKH